MPSMSILHGAGGQTPISTKLASANPWVYLESRHVDTKADSEWLSYRNGLDSHALFEYLISHELLWWHRLGRDASERGIPREPPCVSDGDGPLLPGPAAPAQDPGPSPRRPSQGPRALQEAHVARVPVPGEVAEQDAEVELAQGVLSGSHPLRPRFVVTD